MQSKGSAVLKEWQNFRFYELEKIDTDISAELEIEISYNISDKEKFKGAMGDEKNLGAAKNTVSAQISVAFMEMNKEHRGIMLREMARPTLIDINDRVKSEVNGELSEKFGIEIENILIKDFRLGLADLRKVREIVAHKYIAEIIEKKNNGNFEISEEAAMFINNLVAEKWVCKCGHENTFDVCTKCHRQKFEGDWACSCGTLNHGKFCSTCGNPYL